MKSNKKPKNNKFKGPVAERHDDMPPTKRQPRPEKRPPRRVPKAIARLARTVSRIGKDAEALAAIGREVGDGGLAEIGRGSLAILMPKLHKAAIAAKVDIETVLEVARAGTRVYAAASKAASGLRSAPSGLMLVADPEQARQILSDMGLRPQDTPIERESRLLNLLGPRKDESDAEAV